MSGSVSVAGGALSIAAEFEDLSLFSTELRHAGLALAEVAGGCARAAADPRAASAAALDPIGAVEVTARTALACLAATETAAGLLALATSLAAAADSYRAADSLRAEGLPLARGLAALPSALADVLAAPANVLSGHGERAQRVLTDDPYLADWALAAASAAGAIANPLVGAEGSVVRSASGLLGSLYRDGTPVLTRLTGRATDDSAGAPRSLTDLLRGLAVRDDASGLAGGGVIDIRFVSHGQSGSRSVIVDLPGTTSWNLNPLSTSAEVSDFGTNLRALGGQSTVYERGVLAALTAAGVRPDEPIMLVGHSEGGLVAAQLATDLAASTRFSVTQVVTAGAPLGLARLPSTVSTLSLENKHDVVPQLDGRDNPTSRNHVTATIDRGEDTVGSRHAVATYLEGAEDVDASDDPSLASWKNQAGGFLDGTSVQTEVFQIRRG